MTERKPTVSVIIAAYNAAGFLSTSVQSALSQTLSDIEVVIVDDASSDETLEVARGEADADPRVVVEHLQLNAGPGTARTAGLNRARGEWVAVLDADDTFESGRLEALVRLADTRRLDAVADNLALVDPGLREVVGRAFPMTDAESLDLTPERFLANSRPGARINLGWMKPLVRRRFLTERDVSWPAIRHAEDFAFTMSILLSGGRFQLVGKSLYRYTQRRGTHSGAKSTASRTSRSAEEQIRAVDHVLMRHDADISDSVRRRLNQLKGEIEVTTAFLDARDHWHAGEPLMAARRAGAMVSHPASFLSLAAARFGPGANRIR